MFTPIKGVSLSRLRSICEFDQVGLVKMIHQPTGKVHFLKGKMYSTIQKTVKLLSEGKYGNGKVQKCYNAEADFYFELYEDDDLSALKKYLSSALDKYLVI